MSRVLRAHFSGLETQMIIPVTGLCFATGAHQINLVAAARAVLDHPKLAIGVGGGALGVAMTIEPDPRQGADPVSKGVVCRYRPVSGHTNHGSALDAEVLGAVSVPSVADREIKMAVCPFDHARSEMAAAARAWAFGIDVVAVAKPGRSDAAVARAEAAGITFVDTLDEQSAGLIAQQE